MISGSLSGRIEVLQRFLIEKSLCERALIMVLWLAVVDNM
jgi:hypothetical protein